MKPQSLSEYLITDYLYHEICGRCGTVAHMRPGVVYDCPTCGSCLWTTRTAHPGPEPAHVQFCDPKCAVCRKTLSEMARLEAQLELFAV